MAELCSMCGASFASPADLVEHTTAEHPAGESAEGPAVAVSTPTEAPWLICQLCGRRFPTPEALAAHGSHAHLSRRSIVRPSGAVG